MQVFRVVSFWLMIILTIIANYVGYTAPMKIAIIISMVLVLSNIILTLKGAYHGRKEKAPAEMPGLSLYFKYVPSEYPV